MWSEVKDMLTGIDWQQFHFLRPKALYLFIPLAVAVIILITGNRERKKWKKIIAPSLRRYMFSKGSVWAFAMPLLLFIIAASCIITGLAGPAWRKRPVPAEKIQAVVLIALDLSRSMLAKDIQPSRLERAKFKISDFLDANPRARGGLVAFAGTAHPVLPFTSDYKLIKHHAASLVNRIMPVQGTNMPLLMDEIDSLMNSVNAPSTVLLMTDAISAEEAALLTSFTQHSVHRIEILLFSTPNGAAIPGHSSVISKQDPAVLQNLSQDTAITITPLTLDKSDVEGIAQRISKKLIFEEEKKQDEKDWDDAGWLLIIPAVGITLFWFRKGWVIQWCWLPLLLSLSSCGVKSRHPDWWYSKDYQGQLYENDRQYSEAAAHFDDDQHKAVAYFKAGNYEAAADLFALDSSATGAYNRGIALAKMGRYDEAMDAFTNAEDLDPSLKNKAGNSLLQAQQAKQKADSILKIEQTSVSKHTKDVKGEKKKDKKDPLKEHKPASKDEELSADTRVKELPKFGNRATDEAVSNIHRAKEAKEPPKDFTPDKADKTASNVLLRQTAADPAEFLHRRFELQVKRYYKHVKKPAQPW